MVRIFLAEKLRKEKVFARGISIFKTLARERSLNNLQNKIQE